MNHYYDLALKPDAEMPINRLMNLIYTKLHKVLHDTESHDIGVSFPRYQVLLGNIIRVHERDWLGGAIGYCITNDFQPTPAGSMHRTVSRKQTTMNLSTFTAFKEKRINF